MNWSDGGNLALYPRLPMEEDPEITELLKRPMSEGKQQAAWQLLQNYRTEALALAKLPDPVARVEEARLRLKESLRRLVEG